MIRTFAFSLVVLFFGIAAIPAHCEDAKKPADSQPSPAAQQTVDPDVLKKFLPIAPKGWKVVDVSSQRDITLGAPTTTAQCSYLQADNKEKRPAIHVELQICDWINRPETLRKMIAMWSVTNDKSDDGYVRGTIVAGFPAEESYDNTDGTHSITLIVGGRYCINLDVYGRPEDALIKWLDLIDLKALAATK